MEKREGYFSQPFRFGSGEELTELRLFYQTLGSPQTDGYGRVNNGVLILHGTGGTGDAFLRPQFADALFKPGQLLDIEKYFIILPDSIGHGRSSKPSDGLRAGFPKYAYRDMVAAQHKLVTEHLGLDQLRLVMGTSMGGMHSWMWGYLYPDMVAALMPLASLPVEIAGRNRMLRRMIIDSITHSPDYLGGAYQTQPAGLRGAIYGLLMMISAAHQWQTMAPTQAAADKLFDNLYQYFAETVDANDLLYQVASSRDYNPQPHLEKIMAPLTAVNSADDLVNPPELQILEQEIKRIKRGKAHVLPISDKSQGHRSHSFPELWEAYLADLLSESGGR